MIDLPNESEREYLDAFGVVSLYVAASPAGEPCMVGTTSDLGATLDQLRKQWHWSIEFVEVFLVADDATARRLIDAIHARIPVALRDRLDTSASQVVALIVREAFGRRIKITGHEQALVRVRAALHRVDDVIDKANDSGELAWFNAAYRAYRLSKGDLAMSYNNARAMLRSAMVRRLAIDAGSSPSADLLDEIGIGHAQRQRRKGT